MSHRRKLERAQFHLNALNQSIGAFSERHPYSTVEEYDREAGQHRVRISHTEPFPDEWEVLIGDCLYNMRSSLDHLWYSIVINYNPDPKKLVFLAFPIRRSPDEWRAHRHKLAEAPEAARNSAETLQPYKRGNGPDDWNRHPLWRLDQLGNIDKHRHLSVIGSVEEFTGFHLSPESNVTLRGLSFGVVAPFKKDAIIFEAEMIDPTKDVKVNPVFTFAVAFADLEGLNRSVVNVLQQMHDHIRDTVFPIMETFL